VSVQEFPREERNTDQRGYGMREDDERPGYLGAMLDSERRLVLVPLDPDQPWIAFRRLRSWMKRRKATTRSPVEVFTSLPETGGAEVITLPARPNGAGH